MAYKVSVAMAPSNPAQDATPTVSEQSELVRYRHPDEFTPEQVAELRRSHLVDAEEYLRWLETGEGLEPCGRSSG